MFLLKRKEKCHLRYLSPRRRFQSPLLHLQNERTFPSENKGPSLLNVTAEEASQLREICKDRYLKMDALFPGKMGDDFSEYLKHVPGCYFLIGAGENAASLQTPLYDFPDGILFAAAQIFLQIAIDNH